MDSREREGAQSLKNTMTVVECPVCTRRYRLDTSKMTKEKMKVRCRKCENTFVISRDMFASVETKPSLSPISQEKAAPPEAPNVQSMTLVIKNVPNETARLRIATRLMHLTRERLPSLIKKLSKTPAIFPVEMNPTEADELLKAIDSAGAEAEFSSRDFSQGRQRRVGVDYREKGWKSKAAAAVLIILLLIGGGLAYQMYREVQKTKDFEQRGIDSALPGGALFYVQLKDLKENWARIRDNETESGLRVLVERLASTPQIKDFLSKNKEWKKGMGVPYLGPNLMDLIGSDVRLAVYGGSDAEAPRIVLTFKGNLKAKLMETLLNWIPTPLRGSLPKRLNGEDVVYAFRPQGWNGDVYFFSEGMVYFVSPSQDLIRISTSLLQGRLPLKKSLRSVSRLSKKGKGTGTNQIGFFYIGLQGLFKSWNVKKGRLRKVSFPEDQGGYGDIFGTITLGQGLLVESMVAVNRESLDQPLRSLFECQPTADKTMAYLPADTIIYASNNCLKLGAYFSWFRDSLKDRPDFPIELDSIIRGISAKTGVDIEKEIFPFLGRGFAYAVFDGSQKEGMKFPGIQLFFQIENRPKVESSIQQLLGTEVVRSWFNDVGANLTKINHEDVPITYLRYQGSDMRLFFLSSLTPGYAFVDDILVIGSELESLKRMVDLSQGRGVPILKDRRFKEIKRYVKKQNAGMTYVDLRAASRMVRGLTSRSGIGGVTGAGDKGEQNIELFLDILEQLNYIWSVVTFEDDHVRVLFYVAL